MKNLRVKLVYLQRLHTNYLLVENLKISANDISLINYLTSFINAQSSFRFRVPIVHRSVFETLLTQQRST